MYSMKWVMTLALPLVASAQQLDLSALDKVAARASSVVNVSLDKTQLALASQFLSGEDSNQSVAKDLVAGLIAVNVRVFEFDKGGSFSSADLDGVRSQLKAPGWSKMIEARERDEIAELYLFSKGNQTGGMTVIAGEKGELAVVNIVGPIDLKILGALAGKFGIPKDVMGGMGAVVPRQPPPPRKPPPPAKD